MVRVTVPVCAIGKPGKPALTVRAMQLFSECGLSGEEEKSDENLGDARQRRFLRARTESPAIRTCCIPPAHHVNFRFEHLPAIEGAECSQKTCTGMFAYLPFLTRHALGKRNSMSAYAHAISNLCELCKQRVIKARAISKPYIRIFPRISCCICMSKLDLCSHAWGQELVGVVASPNAEELERRSVEASQQLDAAAELPRMQERGCDDWLARSSTDVIKPPAMRWESSVLVSNLRRRQRRNRTTKLQQDNNRPRSCSQTFIIAIAKGSNIISPAKIAMLSGAVHIASTPRTAVHCQNNRTTHRPSPNTIACAPYVRLL